MKKVLTILFFAVTLIITTLGFSASGSGTDKNNESMPAEIKEMIDKQSEAVNTAISFKESGITEDQYGGMYIDEDGKLHVNFVEIDEKASKLTENGAYIHQVKYTLQELRDAEAKALDIFTKNDIYFNLLAVDEELNQVEVTLHNSLKESKDENIIAALKEIEEIECLEVIYSDNMYYIEKEANYNVYMGAPVYGPKGDFSIGYPIKTSGGAVVVLLRQDML